METLNVKQNIVTSKPAINVIYDAENDWLCITWSGNHTEESILTFTKEIEETLRKIKCRKILNINSNFWLSWPEAPIWVVKNWFPKLFGLGCNAFAWVISSQFTPDPIIAEVFKTQNPFLQAMVFTEEETAAAWLNDN